MSGGEMWSPAIQSVFLDNRELSLSRESLGLITTTLDNVLSRVLRETFRNEARSVSANSVDQQRQPQLIYDTMLSLMPIELLDDCQPQPQQAQQQQPTLSISVENSPFMFSQSLVKQRLQDGLIDIDENLVESVHEISLNSWCQHLTTSSLTILAQLLRNITRRIARAVSATRRADDIQPAQIETVFVSDNAITHLLNSVAAPLAESSSTDTGAADARGTNLLEFSKVHNNDNNSNNNNNNNDDIDASHHYEFLKSAGLVRPDSQSAGTRNFLIHNNDNNNDNDNDNDNNDNSNKRKRNRIRQANWATRVWQFLFVDELSFDHVLCVVLLDLTLRCALAITENNTTL